jgi:ATP phosphoribosyltransferase regulatory subunit
MTAVDRWLLPDGVEEILPAEARKLEALRRRLLDLYDSWGYDLVITPLIEFLDSLLVGSSHDLDLHTFKLTDQLSGRMMGVRADITPQVARIDAHSLHREGTVRLCYADSVLHTRPRGLLASRAPIRIGAELFGHSGPAADIELICLMHQTMQSAEIGEITLVLGHVGIFRTLVQAAALTQDVENELFDALQRKAYEEIDGLLERLVSNESLRGMLKELSRLSGDASVLQKAQHVFRDAPAAVKAELRELEAIAKGVQARLPETQLGFDLCELRGYQYHTGIVFAAYTPGYGRAVAKGGRYDAIGEVYGRARPASGFDSDLKTLARLSRASAPHKPGIFAPESGDAALQALIAELRSQGERVVCGLDAEPADAETLKSLGCDRKLVKVQGAWQLENMDR